MDTLTAINAQERFVDLIKETIQTDKTFKIQYDAGSAILLSEKEYEGLIETLELLSIPNFRESLQSSVQQILTGETYSVEDIFGEK